MRVKVCGVRNEDDIKVAIQADADAVGFLVGQVYPSSDFILPSTAARLAELLPPYITPVLVTHLTNPEAIKEIAFKSNIFTIQLHGGSSIEEVKEINKLLPKNSKLIFSAHVIQNDVEPALANFYPLVDAIVLDSYNKDDGAVGGTGMPHNWVVSEKIVAESPVPVILAGGLKHDNVAKAIAQVQPYGVDANSGLKNEEGEMSVEKCSGFVRNAKQAAWVLSVHGQTPPQHESQPAD